MYNKLLYGLGLRIPKVCETQFPYVLFEQNFTLCSTKTGVQMDTLKY